MKNLPFILIYSRILIGFLIISLAFTEFQSRDLLIAILMFIGLLTDVFDGIIARKLNVSSEKLRIWDSNVDQFFWLSIIASIFYLKLEYIQPILIPIGILIGLEALTYIISYFKFKKPIATHSILAKFWTLTLLFFLTELILYSTTKSFVVCLWLGIVSRTEIILIILMLKKWTTDVPSLWVVKKINSGKKIKKNKLFNS